MLAEETSLRQRIKEAFQASNYHGVVSLCTTLLARRSINNNATSEHYDCFLAYEWRAAAYYAILSQKKTNNKKPVDELLMKRALQDAKAMIRLRPKDGRGYIRLGQLLQLCACGEMVAEVCQRGLAQVPHRSSLRESLETMLKATRIIDCRLPRRLWQSVCSSLRVLCLSEIDAPLTTDLDTVQVLILKKNTLLSREAQEGLLKRLPRLQYCQCPYPVARPLVGLSAPGPYTHGLHSLDCSLCDDLPDTLSALRLSRCHVTSGLPPRLVHLELVGVTLSVPLPVSLRSIHLIDMHIGVSLATQVVALPNLLRVALFGCHLSHLTRLKLFNESRLFVQVGECDCTEVLRRDYPHVRLYHDRRMGRGLVVPARVHALDSIHQHYWPHFDLLR